MAGVGFEAPRGILVACDACGFEEKEVNVEIVDGYGGRVIVGICVETRESRVNSKGVGAIIGKLVLKENIGYVLASTHGRTKGREEQLEVVNY
jgi:hypothetical protein